MLRPKNSFTIGFFNISDTLEGLFYNSIECFSQLIFSDPTVFEYLLEDVNMAAGLWSAQTISGDVTYLVNYFRGLTMLTYCPDYETAWPTPEDLPANAPEGWPNCEGEPTDD